VRKSWEVKKLGAIAQIGAGNSAPQDNALFRNGFHPFFRTSDVGLIRIGHIDTSVDMLNEVGIKKLKKFPTGTILFPKSGASTFLNHRVMMAVDGYVSSHLATIKADHTSVIDRYLFYFLTTVRAQDLIQDHSYPSLRLSEIEEIDVPLPLLPEQKRIVAILDEAFEGIGAAVANAEKNLANARDLFDGYLRSAFSQRGPGWEEKTLKEVSAEFGRGKSKHRPRGDVKLLGGQYPLIQTGDVANSNHRIVEYSQTYNEFGLAQSKLWQKGTVCIAIVGANVAETAILDFDACFPDSVIGLVVDDRLADNEYVEFLLQTFKAILKQRGKGTARDNINLATFENQTFPFPDVAEQRQIVARINDLAEQTQRLESLYQQKLDDLAELKQAVLQKAFAGELTAQPEQVLQEAVA
jgi:type I restriction enzyme, S subunit